MIRHVYDNNLALKRDRLSKKFAESLRARIAILDRETTLEELQQVELLNEISGSWIELALKEVLYDVLTQHLKDLPG